MEPDTQFISRVFNTPSRLWCPHGWSDETTDAFRKMRFEQLVLIGGPNQPFDIPDVGRKAKNIRNLALKATDRITGLEQFENIERLDVEFAPANGIDLRIFPKLKNLFVEWDKKIGSQVFELNGLESVGFYPYPHKTLDAIAGMTRLTSLGITRGSLTTLTGIGRHSVLKSLSLAYLRNLNDIDDIHQLTRLSRISLTNLPNAVSELRISEFPSLDFFYLVDSRITADLSGISNCKKLEKLWINVPATGLAWKELFKLRKFAHVSVVETEAAPGDRVTLEQLASTNGYTIVDFKRIRIKKTKIRSGFGIQLKLARMK